eukprot:scaffold548610_cov42-Prasinocladus_malaysianus.AAC.1
MDVTCGRIVPGEWIGPYVICKALAAVVNRLELGLCIHVVSEPGGGAPTIYSKIDCDIRFPQLLLVPLTLGVGK